MYHRQVVYTEVDTQYNMQVFRCWDLIGLNISCLQTVTVLLLISSSELDVILYKHANIQFAVTN